MSRTELKEQGYLKNTQLQQLQAKLEEELKERNEPKEIEVEVANDEDSDEVDRIEVERFVSSATAAIPLNKLPIREEVFDIHCECYKQYTNEKGHSDHSDTCYNEVITFREFDVQLGK